MGKRSPIRAFLAVILTLACVFLSACGVPMNGAPTATPIPTCVSPIVPNLYASHDIEDVVALYQLYINNYGNPGVLENLRKEAFLRLVELVHYESATHMLPDAQSPTVQATVTLLDPALIQYAILNQMLYNIAANNLYVDPGDSQYGVEAFRGRVRSAMTDIAAREELLFLVTVTSTSYNTQAPNQNISIEIPFEEMELINASDVRVSSTHDDHNLGAPMQIGNDVVGGLVGFPFGLGVPGQCNYILDAWNTSLTLEVSGIRLGDNDPLGMTMWTVPFHPLIHDDFIHHGDPFYHSSQYRDLEPAQIMSIPVPPTPAANSNPLEASKLIDDYWQKTSQYVWYVIIMSSHR